MVVLATFETQKLERCKRILLEYDYVMYTILNKINQTKHIPNWKLAVTRIKMTDSRIECHQENMVSESDVM